MQGQFEISRSTRVKREYHVQPGTGGLEIRAAPLDFLMHVAYGVHQRDIVYEVLLDRETLYDVVAVPKDGGPRAAKELLRSQLESSFAFQTAREFRRVDVWALRRSATVAPLPKSTSRRKNVVGRLGRFEGERASMADLARFARSLTERPVVDETGLTDLYDFVMEWEHSLDGHAFLQAFEDLGLELVPAEREVEFLIVRPRAPAGSAAPYPRPGAEGG